ncbi:M23 family metallopeptidase [bacterium]|nr:M23 family metallopeptidase [bacterium]
MFRTMLSCLMLCSLLSAQDYAWPIRASRSLSATFCEYRSGHLHAGVDIKTWGEMEVPCLAVDEGYIERIVIGYKGYGRGLFLRLKDGNVAVYGHLERFGSDLEDIIQSEQLLQDRYSLRLEFPADKFRVKAGQVIGYSGTSGTEYPHLHFEVRDSLNLALNPQLFYSGIKDSKAPVLDEILLIPSSPDSRINASKLPRIVDLEMPAKPVSITGPFQIAINTHDRADGTLNKYNIYRAEAFVNDSLVFMREFDQVEMKLTDSVDDIYPGFRGKRGWRFMSMFTRGTGQSPFAPKSLDGNLKPAGVSTLEVRVADINGNQTIGGLLFRGQGLDSWGISQANGQYIITRSYLMADYQRVQFFSGANTFIPVAQTLYRLNSTMWIIDDARGKDGIRALKTSGGDIKWVLPPQIQEEPELEYHWISKDGGYMLRFESAKPYTYPLSFQLSGPRFQHRGELIQTAPHSAETELIPLTLRAESELVQLLLDSTIFASLGLKPFHLLNPNSIRELKFDQYGFSLNASNSGSDKLYVLLDSISSVYDNKSVIGASVRVLGGPASKFSAELLFKQPAIEQSLQIFSPVEKDTWEHVDAHDTTGGTMIELQNDGDFFLLRDDQPPTVRVVGEKSSIQHGDRLVFDIKDNTGVIPHPRHAMTAALDNQKFFPDFNPLRGELSFRVQKNLSLGTHEFSLSVEDESGNQTQFSHHFIVKP